jgi:hypothetical protein
VGPPRAHHLERQELSAAFVRDFTNTSALVAVAAQHGFTEEEARRIINDPGELAAARASTTSANTEANAPPDRSLPGNEKSPRLSGAFFLLRRRDSNTGPGD